MRHFSSIRKRKEYKGGNVSNLDKLAEDFSREVQLGKAQPDMSNPSAIKKKFSI